MWSSTRTPESQQFGPKKHATRGQSRQGSSLATACRLVTILASDRWTTGRIMAIHDLFEATVKRCQQEAPGVYSKELIELVFQQPYCKIALFLSSERVPI